MTDNDAYAGKTPKELYPGWPDSRLPKLEPAHQVIEDSAANVFRRYRNNTLKEFAEDTGVSASTISDLTRGNAWPSALTVARLEVAVRYPLWPRKHVHTPKPKPREAKPIRFRKNSYDPSSPDAQASFLGLPDSSVRPFFRCAGLRPPPTGTV
ncbi:helix-turn-helix transcriptional regulator [uncultured Lawsonella sp.]|uniref:helix-turn-helix domain-containing protein n=1 Tax=uncultured Lawsonella sp. TaxID=1847727 RepID=UPI00262C10BE|nr:helix-turn-helix transcriptional regulator [uncultured Lawsonella sp.]